ncbi:MAG: DUF1730 domain-containing protein [Clostridiales bacterium]|nr:DUF1730 domain-containing protein [Clostridiales bacterium]
MALDKRSEKILNDVAPAWGVCDYCDFAEHILPCRAASKIPENSKSIITMIFPYYLGEETYENSNISRYAVVPDYNNAMRERLSDAAEKLALINEGEQFVAFCGNSPFPEVVLAEKSGLGSKGINGLLLTREYGSWVFIGEIVTTMKLEPSTPCGAVCDGCGKCISACPTGALSRDGFDITKCLSAISQQKADLTPEQEKMIISTGCAWGCDICQKACPKNSHPRLTDIPEFLNDIKLCAESGDDLKNRAYGWRGRKVIERNLKLFDDK